MAKDWLGLVFTTLVFASAAHAQLAWSSAPSPTRETLHAVASGADQFVAVGDQGVILTSPDGQQWTQRHSGTSVRLRGVTLGSGLFVVVGDGTTVLLSHDGREWRPAGGLHPPDRPVNFTAIGASGTRFLALGEGGAFASSEFPPLTWLLSMERIPPLAWRGITEGLGQVMIVGSEGVRGSRDNFEHFSLRSPAGVRELEAVTFDRGRFVAVGQAGVTVTSRDGLAWEAATTGSSTTLRGVAPFNGLFVAVGDSGRILTSSDGMAWAPQTSSSTANLRSVAASATMAVAVGTEGTLLFSHRAALPPSLVAPPDSVSEEAGGATYLSVEATGSQPLTYQWSFEGTRLTSPSEPRLRFTELNPSHAGNYTVTITNAHGSLTTTPVRLTVLPAAAPRVIDSTFDPRTSVSRAPTALHALSGDRLLVAGAQAGRLLRLREDGTRDSSFAEVQVSAAPSEFADPDIEALAVQADNRILAGGRFSIVNGQVRQRLVRLLEGGSVDTGFTAPPEITDGPGVRGIAVGPGGKIYVANGTSRVWRLRPDGSLDPEFTSREVPSVPDEPRLLFHTLAVAPDGNLVAGGSYSGVLAHAGPVRFKADGQVDFQLSVPLLNPAGASFTPYETDALRVLPDGRILAAGTRSYWNSRFPTTQYLQYCSRYLPSGEPDPDFAIPSLADSTGIRPWSRVWFYPDGRTLLTRQVGYPAVEAFVFDVLVRLRANGSRDPDIGGAVHLRLTPSGREPPPSIRQVLALGSGKLVLGGNLSLVNDPKLPFIARLNETATEGIRAPEQVELTAVPARAAVGETVTYRVSSRASGPLVYHWGNEFARDHPRQDERTAIYPVVPVLTVVNARGQVTPSIWLQQSPSVTPPRIVSQPTAVSTQSGRDLELGVQVVTDPFVRSSYEWRRNGEFVAYTEGRLIVSGVTAAAAGTYTVIVRDQFGHATAGAPMVVTVDDTSRLVNLSARAWVGPGLAGSAGEKGMFAGFVIPGPSPRRVLIRGIGPALGQFGVAAPLRSTHLAVFSPQGAVLRANQGWDLTPSPFTPVTPADFAAVGAFPLAPGSKDAALVLELEPGAYTATLTGQINPATGDSDVGVGLIEVYEYDTRTDRLTNLSTRVTVGIGGEVAIPGLAVRGAVPKQVLVRAVGPGLAAFGVGSPLPDPKFELRDNAGQVIGASDDWSSTAGTSAIRQAAAAVGAFTLAEGSKDAAHLFTLAPGNYTLVVTGAPATSGVTLIEVYEVP